MQTQPPIAADAHRRNWGIVAVVFMTVLLAVFIANRDALRDENGNPLVNDFVVSWATAHAIAEGEDPAALYDPARQSEVQQAQMGYAFPNQYSWQYPPLAYFLVLPLAFLSFGVGWAAWVLITGGCFAAVMARIAGHWAAAPLFLLLPVSLWNALAGQNGFLTAALVGLVVLCMDKRPLLSGVMLGLLVFKPHLGLVFPFVLLAERRWRMFIAASITVLVLVATSIAVFGVETWQAFFLWLPIIGEKIVVEGGVGYEKMHSLAGWTMLMGWKGAALPMQAVMAMAVIFSVIWVRRQPVSVDMQRAALALAPVLVTPYIWIYDLVLLAVPLAFVLHAAWKDGFLRAEKAWIFAVAGLLAIFPQFTYPLGFLAAVLVAAMLVRRMRHEIAANSD